MRGRERKLASARGWEAMGGGGLRVERAAGRRQASDPEIPGTRVVAFFRIHQEITRHPEIKTLHAAC